MSDKFFKSSDIPASSGGSTILSQFMVEDLILPATRDKIAYQMAKKVDGRGAAITFPTYETPDLPSETITPEMDLYPEIAISNSGRDVSIYDSGLTVKVTRQALETEHDKLQLLRQHQEVLKELLGRDLEKKAFTALRSNPYKAVLSSASAIVLYPGTSVATAAASDANVYLVQRLATIAKQTLNMPVREGGKYAFIGNYFAGLSIVNDANFRNQQQGSNAAFLPHYAGSLANLVDIHNSNDAEVGLLNTNYSGWYLAGKDSHVCVQRRAPRIVVYDNNMVKDTEFGKFIYLHWDFAMGFGIMKNSVNKDNVHALIGSST
jgi:hypothetical protein